MLIWYVKQVKNFMLKFSIRGSFSSQKEFLNLYTMILFFPPGGCVDEDVDNRTNYQGYKYINFVWYHTLSVLHFMNGEGGFYFSKIPCLT